MALNFAILKQLMERLRPGHKVCAFGYPDITCSPQQMDIFTRGKVIGYRADSEAICHRHGISPVRDIPDADSVFRVMGAKLDVFDVIQERGNEILCDLNFAMDIKEQYDFVLDVGTMEHCFNVGQAMMNMAAMLKVGGVIFHENPMVMLNHGFWSMNPTLYADFYEQNGFELLGCSASVGRLGENKLEDVPLKKRFNINGEFRTTTILAAAIRKEIVPFKPPVQSKYKALLAAAGNRA